ncbi:hypothetical protein BH24ACI5_BH24ACI5_28420 [soil metagenome]
MWPRIHAWRNGYITAPATPSAARFGFVFARGTISGEPDVRTYLGRPWRDHAQVTFLGMTMSAVIRPEGWHNWAKPEREKTSRFVEFESRGPGANPRARVGWARRLTPNEAAAMPAAPGVMSG